MMYKTQGTDARARAWTPGPGYGRPGPGTDARTSSLLKLAMGTDARALFTNNRPRALTPGPDARALFTKTGTEPPGHGARAQPGPGPDPRPHAQPKSRICRVFAAKQGPADPRE